MKLLMHNFMSSNVKGVKPCTFLELRVASAENEENEFDADFARSMLPRLEYPVLVSAAKEAGYNDLPPDIPEKPEANEDFLRRLHYAICNIDVVEGELRCPESGRVFPIKGGIPNMLLNEDEV